MRRTSCEHLREPVDVGRAALLGDRDQEDVVQALVVAAEGVARMDAARARVRDHVARAPRSADGELLEGRPVRERERQAEPLLRVGAEAHARLAELAQPLRAEPGQVDEAGEREQGLVRGDVRRRFLAADVLLPRLQRQHVAALAVQVGRLADDAARQPARVLGLRGEEPVVRTGVGLVVAGALALADRDCGAVVAGRLEDAERDRVDVGDRQRARLVRGCGQLGRGLEAAEEVRLLEDHRGGVLGRLARGRRVDRPALVRHLDDLEAEAGRVGLHDLPHLRVQRLARARPSSGR